MNTPVKTAMQVMEIFPTPVFVVQSEGMDNQMLANTIYAIRDDEIKRGIADKDGRSNNGGFRSYDLLPLREFDSLKQLILNTLNERIVSGKWFAEPQVTLEQFGAMWGVINSRGHSNATHNHPGSWLSGVYYAKVPKNVAKAGSLGFRDPILARTYTRSFYRSVQAEVCAIEPGEGKMMIFPSWCEHHVAPNNTDEDRIAIAFNINHHPHLR